MKDQIKKIILACLQELKDDNELEFEVREDMKLIGSQGCLDSLDFVNLVVEIEGRVSDELDKNISILSEKAFSQNNSPFHDIDSFTSYLEDLING